MSLDDIIFKPKIDTAPKVGIESKKEIFAASYRLNLKILAAVIVIPDLLTQVLKIVFEIIQLLLRFYN